GGGGGRHAAAAPPAGRGGRRRRPERRPRALETLREPHRRLQLLTRRQALALPEEVPLAEGQPVHAEGVGEAVHLALVGEGGLGGAEAAEGRGRRVVGQDRHAVPPDGRDAGKDGGVDRPVGEHEWSGGGGAAGFRIQLYRHGGHG